MDSKPVRMRAKFFGNLPEVGSWIRSPGINVLAARLLCNPIHDADSVSVARGELAVSHLGVADGVHEDVCTLRGLDGGHHVVGAGVVLSVTENEQRPTASFLGEFFGDGVENGI